jgi:hypothetical protein
VQILDYDAAGSSCPRATDPPVGIEGRIVKCRNRLPAASPTSAYLTVGHRFGRTIIPEVAACWASQ